MASWIFLFFMVLGESASSIFVMIVGDNVRFVFHPSLRHPTSSHYVGNYDQYTTRDPYTYAHEFGHKNLSSRVYFTSNYHPLLP